MLAAGLGAAGYAFAVKRYSALWLVGAFVPFTAYNVFTSGRQSDKIENAYR